MITEVATVNQIGNEWIDVTSEIKSTCSSCQQVDNCGSGQVAKAFPQKSLSLRLSTRDFSSALSIGDKVKIAIPQDKLLASLARVYGLPLLFLITFSGIGQITIAAQSHELFSIVFGLFGGYLGYRLAQRLESKQNNQQSLMPYLVEKIEAGVVQQIQL